MTAPRVVSVGEVLWDLLPTGPQLGGAPCNLACHIQSLGGAATLVSRIGNDELGRRARSLLAARGMSLDGLETDPSAPTGTVAVDLDATGQPRYTILEHVAWDNLSGGPAAMRAASEAEAICFGTLSQRTPTARAAVHALLRGAQSARLILCDINLRDPFHTPEVIESSLKAATALKLNESELPVLARSFQLPGGPEDQMAGIARRFNLDWVIVTLGASGSQVWHEGQWTSEPGLSVAVRDTVGAGDSFTAAFIIGTLRGWPVATTLRRATAIAAYVCTQSGATPDLPPELTGPFLKASRHS